MARSFYLLLLTIFFFSCEKNDVQDLLPNITVNTTVNLNLPQYINLQTPSGWATTTGGVNGILVLNTGSGSTPYKAFDLACPNYHCSTAMTFDGSLKLKCSCDNSTYSVLNGAPQTTGYLYFAREYRVSLLNNNTLNISNF